MKSYQLNTLVVFILVFFYSVSNAQLTHIDTTFSVGSGASNIINKIDIQSSGKVILSGDFQIFNGSSNKRIVRLLQNGVVDTSFTSGLGVDGPIRATFLLANDKLIIGGIFNTYNTTPVKNLARINANGTIDNTFNAAGVGPNNEVIEIFTQKDGKILISGFFSKYNNVNFTGFLRLESDGSIDTNFALGSGTNLSPDCFAQQTNGKILIGGPFLRYKGVDVNKIFRIHLDGTLDTTFNSGFISGHVFEMLTLPDDKIIISGSFSSVNGRAANRIARLHRDGNIDTTFNSNFSSRIRSMHLQKDGKLILVGDFTTVNSQTTQRLVRLNTDGSLDNTAYVGTNGTIYDIAEQQDQNIIIAGNFTQLTQVGVPNTVSSNKVVRINNAYAISAPCTSATAPILNINTDTILCKPTAITASVIAGSINSGSNWFWYADSIKGALVDSGVSITVHPKKSTTYFVTAGLTCNDTVMLFDSFSVILSDTMKKNVYVGSASLGAEESNAISYQWYKCDSTMQILTGDTGQYYTPTSSGHYAVVMINNYGCTDTSNCVEYLMPALFISKTNKLTIKNPVHGLIQLPNYIQMKNAEIISSAGLLVAKFDGVQEGNSLDVSTLAVGVYYLRLTDTMNKVYFDKILIH